MVSTTYKSKLNLNLGQVPAIDPGKDPDLYTELLDIHDAIEQIAGGLVSEWLAEVALGNIAGFSIEKKYGRNDGLTNGGGFEALWNGGGEYTGHNAIVAETLECFSANIQDAGTVLSSGTATGGSTTTLVDSAATFSSDGVAAGDVVINDTNLDHGIVVSLTGETQINVLLMSGGTSNADADAYRIVTKASTGAPVLKLKNLRNGTYAAVEAEYIVLNGTAVVDTTGTYIRCSRGKLHGAIGINDITVRQKTTTANIMMVMPAGYNSTMIAADTIPAGKTGYFIRAFTTLSGRTKASSIARIRIRQVNDFFHVQEEFAMQGDGNTYIPREYFPILKGPYPEMSDIFIEADTDTSTTSVAGGWQILYVDN